MIFLTESEVEDLTGYKNPSAQRRWFEKRGYRFAVRADGRPRVMVAEVERHMLGTTRTKRTEPNYNALCSVGGDPKKKD